MANTYTYSGPGTRWAEGDPTSEDKLNIARINVDHVYEALNLLQDTAAATATLKDGVVATTQSAADNSTKIATTAYADAAGGVQLANDANNRIVTADGSGGINGEANLTFDGSTLNVTGAVTCGTFTSTGIDDNASSTAVTIHSSGNVSIGTTSEIATVGAESSAAAPTVLRGNSTHASSTGTACFLDFTRAASSAYSILRGYSGGAADLEFHLRGDGNAYADGSWSGSGADYQELFESTTGAALEVGRSVVIDAGKVRIYNAVTDTADDIIGVVRPKSDNKNSAVIGNTAWNHWTDKYLTDEWGVYERENITVWTWTVGDKEQAVYERDMSDDWSPPPGAVSSTESVRKLNPSYDPNSIYDPRIDRNEWNLIGLLGQIQIKASESTNPRWVKMADISGDVELWYVR